MYIYSEATRGHLSHLDDPLASVDVRRAFTYSSQELLGQSLPNLMCSICRIRRQKILLFPTPTQRGGNFEVKNVKLMYFLKDILLYSGAWFRQTVCIVIMTKEGATKLVYFMIPGTEVIVLGLGQSYSEYALFLLKSSSLLLGMDYTI